MADYSNVEESTVSKNNCIGCGICEAVCPHDAINMIYTDFKELQPLVNEKCADNCTICVSFCPFTENKIIQEANIASMSSDANSFGLHESEYYIAYDKRKEKRIKSASGGVVTELAVHMLESKRVDAVIHADMIESKNGEMHYKASISQSTAEVESKRSSFYAPISFESVIKEFISQEQKILFIGVPCVVRAVNYLFDKHKLYKKNKVYTIALSCSHNVNGQFIDYLAESESVGREEYFKVNLRNNDNVKDVNHFNNHYYSEDTDGDIRTIFKKDRFDTVFTESWRNYFFTMNICNKCSDFWGYTADISVKDAWGKWVEGDSLGKSIVVIRNEQIKNIFNDDNNIYKEALAFSEVENSQIGATKYKQVEINERLHRPKSHINNIINSYFMKDTISRLSKKWYSELGYEGSRKRLKYLVEIAKIIGMYERGVMKLKRNQNAYIRYIIFYVLKIKNLFLYRRDGKTKQIMITGGYGYKNVGDEAQLNATLQWLDVNFPEYRRVVLTHDRHYTYIEHGGCAVYDSPREAFFNHNQTNAYSASNLPVKVLFLLNSLLIYLNSYLVRAGLPTFLITAKKAALLEELKKTDLLFYSGGGYMTGKTLSRLWDGVLFIAVARVMKVPVVLSGQTIGVWNGVFNKYYARWGLSKASVITTRDPVDSIASLREIGVEGDDVFVTFDDALFCDKANDKDVLKELEELSISDDQIGEYITLNIHYWGIEKNSSEKSALRKRVNSVIDLLVSKYNKKVVLIAMTPSDYEAIDDYLNEYPDERVIKYVYKFDFRLIRGVIAKSSMCITMKHHPIIFAVGEKVPVISLANFDYYEHKNGGALKLFGLENFNIVFDDSFALHDFSNVYEELVSQDSDFSKNTEKMLKKLKKKKSALAEKCRVLLSLI